MNSKEIYKAVKKTTKGLDVKVQSHYRDKRKGGWRHKVVFDIGDNSSSNAKKIKQRMSKIPKVKKMTAKPVYCCDRLLSHLKPALCYEWFETIAEYEQYVVRRLKCERSSTLSR